MRYVLDPSEMLLRELVRAIDAIDSIDDALARDGLLVTGSRGQLPRAHPLLLELQEHQKIVSRLVAELALPLPGEQVSRPAPQSAAEGGGRYPMGP